MSPALTADAIARFWRLQPTSAFSTRQVCHLVAVRLQGRQASGNATTHVDLKKKIKKKKEIAFFFSLIAQLRLKHKVEEALSDSTPV